MVNDELQVAQSPKNKKNKKIKHLRKNGGDCGTTCCWSLELHLPIMPGVHAERMKD